MAEEAKTVEDGSELYRELCRWHPDPQVPQYYKGVGGWQKDVLKIDAVLLQEHRKEAGADPPKPLEDIPKPDTSFMLMVNPMLQKAASAPGVLTLPGKPTVPVVAAIRPGGLAVAAGGQQGISAAAVAAAELKAMALFVARWKLEPTKTKNLLAPLPSVRRRWVLANFKADAMAGEAPPIEKLEAFIKESAGSNAWPAATSGGTAAGVVKPQITVPAKVAQLATRPVVAPNLVAPKLPTSAGRPQGPLVLTPTTTTMQRPMAMKRPMPPVLTLDPSKRPKLMGANGGIVPNVNLAMIQQRKGLLGQPGLGQAWQVRLPGQVRPVRPDLSSPRPVGVIPLFRG